MLRPLFLMACLCSSLAVARAESVVRVADINPGGYGADVSYLTVFNDALYFRANNLPGGSNPELWRFDGSDVSLAADVLPGSVGSAPAYLTAHGGHLYFNASGPGGGGPKFWRFNGAAASLVPDPTNQAPQNPGEMISFGGNLYYSGWRSNLGLELWKFNGVSQTPLDLWPGSGSSGPKEFVVYNNQFYFNAVNQELWRLNANTTSATQVTDIAHGNGSSPEHMAVFNGQLYFSAYDHVRGRELWRFDGVTASLAADIVPGGQYDSSNPTSLTVYNNALYFAADNGVDGAELWRYDGTQAEMVVNINPLVSPPGVDPVHHGNPSDLFVHQGILYFAADDGVHGRELWSYDGAVARLVADINPGPYGSDVNGFVEFRGQMFFGANDGQSGGELNQLLGPAVFQLAGAPLPAVAGDANGDGVVSGADYIAWADNFGAAPGHARRDQGDFNGDRFVDALDYAVWNQGYTAAPGSVPTPEPTTALLAGLAAASLTICRWRRRRESSHVNRPG